MSETTEQPCWRSLLFVPADNPRFVDKAHLRGADAIILDLEDSVAPVRRGGARARLAESAASAARGGADILVRINRDPSESEEDLDAAVNSAVRALMLPKADSFEHVRMLSVAVAGLERSRDMTPGSIRFMPMIETAQGLLCAREIAAADRRNMAMNFGAEDFAADTGLVPDEETLLLPNQLTLYAARAAGLMPLGLLNTIANYQDLDVYRALVRRSIRFGYEGASCIHPSSVAVLNEEFSPAPAVVDAARRIVDAYDKALADGTGAISVDGKMIDVPVAERAARTLRRATMIAARNSRG